MARFPRLVPGPDFKSGVERVTTFQAGSIPVPRRQSVFWFKYLGQAEPRRIDTGYSGRVHADDLLILKREREAGRRGRNAPIFFSSRRTSSLRAGLLLSRTELLLSRTAREAAPAQFPRPLHFFTAELRRPRPSPSPPPRWESGSEEITRNSTPNSSSASRPSRRAAPWARSPPPPI